MLDEQSRLGLKSVFQFFFQSNIEAHPAIGFSSSFQMNLEREFDSTVGFHSAITFFNYSEWLSKNREKIVRRYTLTLTGTPDGKEDVLLPMENFQARLQLDLPTYLAVSIPSMDYADAISERPNGEMIVHMVYVVDGKPVLSEPIVRTDVRTVTISEGARSQSIQLAGYRNATYTPKQVELKGVIYRRTDENGISLQLGYPDLYLRPGDTTIYDSNQITVRTLDYILGQGQSTMYVTGN